MRGQGLCHDVIWSLAQNKMHINDWSAIQTLFDKLNKQLEKSMKVRGSAVCGSHLLALHSETQTFLQHAVR